MLKTLWFSSLFPLGFQIAWCCLQLAFGVNNLHPKSDWYQAWRRMGYANKSFNFWYFAPQSFHSVWCRRVDHMCKHPILNFSSIFWWFPWTPISHYLPPSSGIRLLPSSDFVCWNWRKIHLVSRCRDRSNKVLRRAFRVGNVGRFVWSGSSLRVWRNSSPENRMHIADATFLGCISIAPKTASVNSANAKVRNHQMIGRPIII